METYELQIPKEGTEITFTVNRKYSDDHYEEERNKLISKAEIYTDSIHGCVYSGRGEERDAWCDAWNKTFHARMNELAREEGI